MSMVKGGIAHVAAGITLALAAQGGSAATPPPAVSDILKCRAVADGAQRLACFDGSVASFAVAQERDDLVVMDRSDVRRAKRSLFGLALPNFNFFGHDKNAKETRGEVEDVDRITETVKSAMQSGSGQWVVTLSDGARWAQTDTRALNTDPRPGMPIVIRRAAMGSFLANIGGQIAIRVHRVI